MQLKIDWIAVNGYERVLRFEEPRLGLIGFIAIHSTQKGPALGGIRICPYASEELALKDALNLSAAMTIKCALASVPFGGGKTTIIGSPKKEKSREYLHAIGHAVNALKGLYICAEDSGICTEDIAAIHEVTCHAVGLPGEKGSGNPAPFTAFGVLRAIKATFAFLDGSDTLTGKHIAIQGVGAVGGHLAQFLFWEGARLTITDIDMEHAAKISHQYGALLVSPEQIIDTPCDLFAPCALGGVLSATHIERLRCRAVVGAANNQLPSIAEGDLLMRRSILYGPDFVANCGGVINVSFEKNKKGYNASASWEFCSSIYDRMLAIYKLAQKEHISPGRAAHVLAEKEFLNVEDPSNALTQTS